MGHWKRLIKIPGGTDCYYCIKIMTYLIHVSSCLVVLVIVSNNLSAIMLHVYFVTLLGTCYTFCGGILLMYMYPLHCIYSVFCIPCRHHFDLCTTPYYGYIAHAHLHVHFYHVIIVLKLDTTVDMTR